MRRTVITFEAVVEIDIPDDIMGSDEGIEEYLEDRLNIFAEEVKSIQLWDVVE